MSFPATTRALSQVGELGNLAREFKFYADGARQISNARAFRSQFTALRNGISTVKKTADNSVSVAQNAKSLADRAKKVTDLVEKGAFKQINPRWGAALSILLQVANAGVTVLAVKSQEEIQGINLATGERIEADLQNTFTRSINNSIKIRNLEQQVNTQNEKISENKAEITSTKTIAERSRALANDALYEVRRGREILEEKISEARKIGNDALYEVRQGRERLESRITNEVNTLKNRIDNLNNQFRTTLDATVDNFQTRVNTTIEGFRQQLQTTRTRQDTIDREIASINQRLRGGNQDENSIANRAANIVFGQVNPRLNQINQDNYGQNLRIDAIGNGLSALGGQLRNIDGRVTILERTPVKLPPQKNYDADIASINNRLKEQERVNGLALPKLDQLLTLIPLIPGRVADNIRPSIPTVPQIEQAAATGFCRTTQPGGCSRRMIDDATGNINANTNNKANNIIDAVNTAANGTQLTLLQKIDNKLGVQLPGGLSGTFGRLWQTLQIDRITNTLTLITTMHNAAMLSRSIGETLFSGFDNIGQLVGFKWKNEKGEDVGFGGIVSEYTEGFFKTIFGEDNYNNAKKSFNAANRMYQSTTNMFYQVQGMFDSARSIAELTANNTGKIGNALKKGGAIFENAFPNMSENTTSRTAYQKKWDNIISELNEIEETVSAFSSITGEMVSIGENFNELKNQRDEFFKAKDDSEKAITALVTGEKEAAKVNQEVNKTHTQKSEE